MITIYCWLSLFSMKVVEEHTYWYSNYELTPAEKAFYIIAMTLITPFMLCLDLILSPLELIFWLLTKHYEKGIK